MKKRIKIQGFLIFAAVVATVAFYEFLFPRWQDQRWDIFFDVLGFCIVLSGFLFRISSRGYKAEKSRSSTALVKDGPYALIRNPMYLGTFLIGCGITITLFRPWAFLLFCTVYLAIYIPQVKKEEAVLLKAFGKEYQDYCGVTPKYCPRFYLLLHLRENLPVKSPWIKKELSSLFAAGFLILAIEAWQDALLFGYKRAIMEASALLLIFAAFLISLILYAKKNDSS